MNDDIEEIENKLNLINKQLKTDIKLTIEDDSYMLMMDNIYSFIKTEDVILMKIAVLNLDYLINRAYLRGKFDGKVEGLREGMRTGVDITLDEVKKRRGCNHDE